MKPLPPPPNTADLPNTSVPNSIQILGSRVDLVSAPFIFSRAADIFSSPKPAYFVTANTLMSLEARNSALLKNVINKASLVIADSSGIVGAAKFLGYPKPERFPGIDLALALCKLAAEKNRPIFLLGGKPGVAERAASHLVHENPAIRIGGTRDGFFSSGDESKILDQIRDSGVRLVLVALGMPRQEKWIFSNLDRLPPALYVGVGGSFDVWAGDLKRAPEWLQSLGGEWLYRLAQEPFRWRRILQLPLFAFSVCRERIQGRGTKA